MPPFMRHIVQSLTPRSTTPNLTPRTVTPNIPEEMIIDSHIHLYPATEQDQLAWLTQNHPLHGQHSVEDYLAVTRGFNKRGPANIRGFVFVETDRKHDLEIEDFGYPLKEVEWLARIQQGLPREGEGHDKEHAKLVLGIVPWAPLPLGPEKLAAYVEAAKKAAGPSTSKIVGFRYLIQDKPLGTCMEPNFIESLKWLGKNNYTFDIGIDMTTESKQGRGCIAMMRAAHKDVPDSEKVRFIINHIIKPDISNSYLIGNELLATREFLEWQKIVWELSGFPQTYMKLSGCLSQMVPISLGNDLLVGDRVVFEGKDRTSEELYELIEPWLSVVLEAFGPRRIMWGSDWPVCEASPRGKGAWGTWRGICQAWCEHNELSEEEKEWVWWRTCGEGYGLMLEEQN